MTVDADPHGWLYFWDLWETGRWEADTKAWLHEVLRPGDLFLDVGAWIGPTARWALDLGAEVIAVEPDPVALEDLRKLPVEIWAGALTVDGGTVMLAANQRVGGEYGDSMSCIGDAGIPVDSWTIDEVLQGRIPAAVKMDVEGYETVLCPAIVPMLAVHKVPLHISCHGTLPSRDLFDGYAGVEYPDDPWGDIITRPV